MYLSTIFLYFHAMKKENLFHTCEILVREYDHFPIEEHEHSFFELGYILEGKGIFSTEQEEYGFEGNSFFIVRPHVTHRYRLDTHSKFIYLRFNDAYLDRYFTPYDKDILYSFPSACVSDLPEKDMRLIRLNMECIASEYTADAFYNIRLGEWWTSSILYICLRNMKHHLAENRSALEQDNRLMTILQYIQANLGRPNLLRSNELSRKFNLSANYIGKYFHAHFGLSLQDYIMQSRLLAVDNLLAHTDIRINEIALRLGFTDESHLTRTFKRYRNITPLKYRLQAYKKIPGKTAESHNPG